MVLIDRHHSLCCDRIYDSKPILRKTAMIRMKQAITQKLRHVVCLLASRREREKRGEPKYEEVEMHEPGTT